MATAIPMPKFGLTMEEGSIIRWLKRESEYVKQGEPLVEIETEKVVVTYEAPSSGTLLRVVKAEGQTVPIGHPICVLGEVGEDIPQELLERPSEPPTVKVATQPATQEPPKVSEAKVSPAAKRLAESKGIDLGAVIGTGPGGTIMREDVLRALRELKSKRPILEPVKIVPLAGIRAHISERLLKSQRGTAHVTLTREADASAASEYLRKLGSDSGVTYTDLFVKVAAQALKQHPMINSWLVEDQIKLYNSINIGVAVALEDGLIVPTIVEADQSSLPDVSRRIKELTEKARRGELSPDDVTGGTFTITNLGMFGVDAFTPIINSPQTAILGVGRVRSRAWVEGEEVVVRPTVFLSLTFDHRVVDGADAARFLDTFVNLLGNLSWLKASP